MSDRYQIKDSDEAVVHSRKPPATLLIESLPPGLYKTYSELSEELGVHIGTLRRICKLTDKEGNPLLKAPSKVISAGALNVYLFTKEDEAEVREYFKNRGRL